MESQAQGGTPCLGKPRHTKAKADSGKSVLQPFKNNSLMTNALLQSEWLWGPGPSLLIS